jgi:hypothetical protein
MRLPAYHEDQEEYLRALAIYARERIGLHAGLAIERCLEHLLARQRAYDLEARDLHREVEDLEEQLGRK